MDETREALARNLQTWPQTILRHELELITVMGLEEEAAAALERKRDDILLTQAPEALGKNAEVREARLRLLTSDLASSLNEYQKQVRKAQARLHWAENEYSAAKHLAALLGPGRATVEREDAHHVEAITEDV